MVLPEVLETWKYLPNIGLGVGPSERFEKPKIGLSVEENVEKSGSIENSWSDISFK